MVLVKTVSKVFVLEKATRRIIIITIQGV